VLPSVRNSQPIPSVGVIPGQDYLAKLLKKMQKIRFESKEVEGLHNLL
jgi:hypothetical protein